MNRQALAALLSVWLLGVTSGCASPRLSGARTGPVDVATMDQARLEKIFSEQVEAITGPTGALQTQIDGITVYCISDPANDQMRLLAPITRIDDLDPRIYEFMLRANFHHSGDARYAISEKVVFAAYLHPMSSLTPMQIKSALSQIVSLTKTFGTSFSSREFSLPAAGEDGPGDEGVEGADPSR